MNAARLALAACLTFVVAGCRGDDTAVGGDAHSELSCGSCHSGSAAAFATRPAPPRACTDCHEPSDLAATVSLDGIELAHLAHGDVAPGVPIPCSGCHSHNDGSEPLTVSSGSCFLCHGSSVDGLTAPAAEADAEARSCRVCHETLTHTALTSASARIPHAVVAERGIPCLQCHYDVLKGSGSVSDAGCVECHGRDGAYASFAQIPMDSLHALHLTRDDAVACTRCHGGLSHEIVGLASTIQLNCLNCHAEAHGLARPAGGGMEWAQACVGCHHEAHRSEQELYTGLGREGAGQLPAVMFLARVSCQSCHRQARQATPLPAEDLDAMNDACVACHGSEYRFMLPLWKTALEDKVARVGRYLEDARAERRLSAAAGADSALTSAAASLNLVTSGRGLHNVPAADALLRGALEEVLFAYRAAGLSAPAPPRMGPNPETVSCAHCHYGVEAVVDSVFGERFSHGPHVLDADLACGECHSPAPYFSQGSRRPDPRHGMTTVTREDCQSCHHVRTTSSCEACHDSEEMMGRDVPVSLTLTLTPPGAPDSREVTFEHRPHLELGCSACHAPGPSASSAVACSDCHRAHHEGSASCLGCHGSEMATAHEVEDHFNCTDCHESGTLEILSVSREFCLACHASRTDHQAGRECTPCHMQSSPTEVKARILGR